MVKAKIKNLSFINAIFHLYHANLFKLIIRFTVNVPANKKDFFLNFFL